MSAPVPSRPSEVKSWCIGNGFHPNRTLGQNFLIDLNTIESIVAFAEVKSGDHVLEVGPGLGAITRAMLDIGAKVVAVEKDKVLADLLSKTFAGNENFTLYCADMLDIPLDSFLATGKPDFGGLSDFPKTGMANLDEAAAVSKSSVSVPKAGGSRVVATAEMEQGGMASPHAATASPFFDKFVSNLPYSVGTRILLDICRHPFAPSRCVVMVQKEVADRLVAAPNTNDRGQASVWVQRNFTPKAFKVVKPTCFWPKPEIASTVVGLSRHDTYPLTEKQLSAFEKITKLAFMHRRKQMSAIFRSAGEFPVLGNEEHLQSWLASASLDPRIRPEAITNDQWHRLACVLADMDNGVLQ